MNQRRAIHKTINTSERLYVTQTPAPHRKKYVEEVRIEIISKTTFAGSKLQAEIEEIRIAMPI